MVRTGAEMHTSFPGDKWTVTLIVSPRWETATWPSQGVTTDHHSPEALEVKPSKRLCLQLVTTFSTPSVGPHTKWYTESWHILYFSPLTFHSTSSYDFSQQDSIQAGLYYSEWAWQVLMTWITQVQRKTTAAMKLSSLHFCLFIFHREVSPGRKLSVLTLCAFSKHLSIVYLQTARLFNANLTA